MEQSRGPITSQVRVFCPESGGWHGPVKRTAVLYTNNPGMFTGIIQKVGKVRSFTGHRLEIERPAPWDEPLAVGESVAVNGCCLTTIEPNALIFDLSEETLSLTTLGDFQAGDLVNLERAMRPVDRFGGHIVQGHVDTTAQIVSQTEHEGSREIEFRLLSGDPRYLAPKGSIAIDGVSLTIVNPRESNFSVALIPHTVENTRFRIANVGDLVNVEFDVLAKHVARLIGRD